jgi:hypothetical protein
MASLLSLSYPSREGIAAQSEIALHDRGCGIAASFLGEVGLI